MRFRLVDRIDGVEAQRIVGAKLIAQSEDILEWHFPEKAIFPGTMILEACVQLAGWWHAHHTSFSEWLLLRHVESARYNEMCTPGDQLDLALDIASEAPNEYGIGFVARVSCGESQRAELRFRATPVPMDDLSEADKRKREYEELRGNTPE